MDSLYNTLVSLLGGGLSGWIIASHQKRLDRRDEEERRKATEAEISEIKASLKELSKSLKAHADADKADVILNELKNISGEQSTQSAMITNISGEVKQLLVADGVRKEKIDSLERYIKGVDTSLREHKRNHPGGK